MPDPSFRYPRCLTSLALLIFLYCPIQVPAQFQLNYQHLYKSNGQEFGHVFDIFEDDEGFVWFCTSHGLIRYNGFDFIEFTHHSDDSTSLSATWCYAGLADRSGTIWVGTAGGLNRLNRVDGSFTRFTSNAQDAHAICPGGVRDIFEDNQGRLWVGCTEGINLLDRTTGKFTAVEARTFRGGRFSPHLMQDHQGNLWATSTQGFWRIDPDALTATQVLPSALWDRGRKEPYDTHESFDAGNGKIWISTLEGVWAYDVVHGSYDTIPLGGNFNQTGYSTMIPYDTDHLMIGSYRHELVFWNMQDQQTVTRSESIITGNLPEQATYTLFRDSRGIVWIGLFHGIRTITPQTARFRIFPNTAYSHDLRNYVLKVYGAPDGTIWMNTMRGIFSRKDFDSPPAPIFPKPWHENQYLPVSDFVMDDTGQLWISVEGEGVFRYDPVSHILYPLSALNATKGITTRSVFRLALDHKNRQILWISSPFGLYRYAIADAQGTWHDPMESLPEIGSNALGKVVQRSDGTLWIESADRILAFDPTDLSFHRIDVEGLDQIGSCAQYDNALWLGDENQVFRIADKTDSVIVYQPGNAPPEDAFTAFEVSGNGDLWLGQNGISRFNPATGHYQSYPADGAGDLIMGNSSQMTDGVILFPCANGILAFQPDNVTTADIQHHVFLRDVKINNASLFPGRTRALPDTIRISSADKFIAFDYGCLGYPDTRNITYTVMLKGFDEQWRDVGQNTTATFTNLGPGTYQFLARAGTPGTLSKSRELNTTLIVGPTLTQMPVFRLGLALVVCLLIYAFYRGRKRQARLQREKEIAQRADDYKSKFLANISHEIRTPMHAIIGMSKLMSNTTLTDQQTQYNGAIRDSSENLLHIVNDLLDHAKIESGQFSFVKRPFEIRTVLQQVMQAIRYNAEEKGLALTSEVDHHIPQYLLGDAVRLHQVILNLVANAIKFTRAGSVHVHLTCLELKHDNALVGITVQDTGVGIPADRLDKVFDSFRQGDEETFLEFGGTGLGLSIVRQLIEQQAGTITVESTPGQGTCFQVGIPYQVAQKLQKQDHEPASHQLPANLRILVVDDTYFNQMLTIELLRIHCDSPIIDVAANGQAALTKLDAQGYDLILMDVRMPIMNGYDATIAIRNLPDPEKRHIPIIGLTASAIPEQLQRCLDVGMQACVAKPIREEELFTAMSRVITH